MATNYTFAQVVKAYADGTNQKLMIEIGRRYPLLMAHVSKLIALAGDEFVAFASAMPEHITANKLNKALLSGEDECGEAEADDGEAEGDEAESDEQDLSSMTTKELYKLCAKKGLKVTKYGKPKSYYIDALNGASDEDGDEGEEQPAKSSSKSEKHGTKTKEAADVEDDEAADEEQSAYEGKSAMELFKLCKKRGVKAQPKKPAKYYVELLTAADKEAADEDADDDWDADDGEAEKKKPAKKTEKKSAKAADDEDDEDWDI